MSHLPDILQLGHPILRQPAQWVDDVHAAYIQQTLCLMQNVLADTQGVGLAAPQIGISQQIIIIASRPSPRYPHAPSMEPLVMINPSFTSDGTIQEKDWEGCLSIPALRAQVPRFQQLTAHYTDRHGQTNTMTLQGFIARIFQHEYDHLHGIVYLDRVDRPTDIIAESEYVKLMNLANP